MIQTPIIEATQQKHHGYDHEYLTDEKRENYPRHFYELPSPFLRITLAIF